VDGKITARQPAHMGAIAALAALAVVDLVYRSRVVEALAGTNDLSAGLVLGAVEDATTPLLLAAVLLSGPALGSGYRTITAGAALILGAAVVTEAFRIWAFGPAWQVSYDTLDPAATAAYRDASLAASVVSIGGWLLIARGIATHRPRLSPGMARLAIVGITVAATIANVAGLAPLYGSPPSTEQAAWITSLVLAATGFLATGLVAVLALATAAPGPPIDWRWPVGIGLALERIAGAAIQWEFVADPYHVPGWLIWLRLLAAGGALLVVAGFAVAAAVRQPGQPSPAPVEDLHAIGS